MLDAPRNCKGARDNEDRTGSVVRAVTRENGADHDRGRSQTSHERAAEVVRLELAGCRHRLRRRSDQLGHVEAPEQSGGADHGAIGSANDVSAAPTRLEAQCLSVVAARRIARRASARDACGASGFRVGNGRRRMTYRLGAGRRYTNSGANQQRPKKCRVH